MSVVGIDLGATKIAAGVFAKNGDLVLRREELIRSRDVGSLVVEVAQKAIAQSEGRVDGIGVCVPGIYSADTGRVWAPNIPDWEDFPLLQALTDAVDETVRVRVESDRACSILGEMWRGAAKGCSDAVFLAVGTGIGAGIVSGGRLVTGKNGISGAIGWLALDRPYRDGYEKFGCFEYWASGDGLPRAAADLMESDYVGMLRGGGPLTAQQIFAAYEKGDDLAASVIERAVELWGMAVANLVSLLNPERIIFGGGVFGPATALLDRIKAEAARWAQPISIQKVEIVPSQLGSDAALYGAAGLVGGSVFDGRL